MERFSFFCCISIFLNFINGDTIQNSTNINCFEDKLQEINELLLEKINRLRKEKNIVPLALEHHLVSGSAEWTKHLAENNRMILSKPKCKYKEFMFMFRNSGSYFESNADPIEEWKSWLMPSHPDFKNFSVPHGQLYWNGTKEVGCGVCSYQVINQKIENTVFTCRVRPSSFSVFDERLY